MPVHEDEFAGLMSPYGPFPADETRYRVAVAVSGGADSLCLGFLAHRWRKRSVALIVDHGLRPEAAQEAQETRRILTRLGMEAHILRLTHLSKMRGMQARARAARYDILTEWCRQHGVMDLLVAHHRRDQAETYFLRKEKQSGAFGLAGMAAARFTPDVRIIRPLRDIPPQRSRATLDAEGLRWIEDPSNRNAQFRRVAIRQALSAQDIDVALSETRRHAALRQAAETSLAAYCGQLTPHPFGFVRINGELPPPEILSPLCQAVSGADWAPSQRRLAQLRAAAQDATLGGVWFFQRRIAGVTRGWCLVREPDAAAQMIDINDVARAEGLIWDRRWRLQGRAVPGITIRRLGRAASQFKTRDLPSRYLMALPAIWRDDRLIAVPHFGFCRDVAVAHLRFTAWRRAPVTDASLWCDMAPEPSSSSCETGY
ncbi:tRNA lysidine(34) synthetase TilS [Candidatus Kirkpatrickella diaphorinae]|uniref:tRNA(Ile)-lysidine synthase n=1 Tax=Candidatus Kirkpatrickella diaphorinae TaxID=2984322 RepID=A0ABY6GGV5_9PROT|nr:tRNA lysidine(34) synthetase TilS [Candidatus Kirkpatrickella diaphorinae]UYH50517.1 tRNA lysidine(34) synthetase TilS [Candidatus Kirkpatrickella diaphorinae]